MSPVFKYTLLALALLAGGGSLALLHLDNRRLERHLAAETARAREAARWREDNVRLERTLAARGPGAGPTRAPVGGEIAPMRAEIMAQMRAEIATLEQKAEEQRAARLASTTQETAAVESTRDPRHGPTRLEFFQDRGQATPSAALETMVWAALKGDDTTLATLTTLNSATRAKAEAMLAHLPAETRAQWAPETLGRLWLTSVFTDISALEIVRETTIAADEAELRLRLPNAAEETLSLRLTPEGWKVLIPAAAYDRLDQKLRPGH